MGDMGTSASQGDAAAKAAAARAARDDAARAARGDDAARAAAARAAQDDASPEATEVSGGSFAEYGTTVDAQMREAVGQATAASTERLQLAAMRRRGAAEEKQTAHLESASRQLKAAESMGSSATSLTAGAVFEFVTGAAGLGLGAVGVNRNVQTLVQNPEAMSAKVLPGDVYVTMGESSNMLGRASGSASQAGSQTHAAETKRAEGESALLGARATASETEQRSSEDHINFDLERYKQDMDRLRELLEARNEQLKAALSVGSR